MIAEELNVHRETVHLNLMENFGMKSVRAKMVPKNLTYNQLQQRRKVYADFLPWILENDEYLNRIITGDESDFNMTLRTMQNMQWKSPDLHLPKKVQFSKSKVRTMLICFFDCKGTVHQEFFPLVRLSTTGSISEVLNV